MRRLRWAVLVLVSACNRNGGLPPVDDDCRVDADCAAFAGRAGRTGGCCPAGSYQVGNRAWVAASHEACDRLQQGQPECPETKGLMPFLVPCVKRHCVDPLHAPRGTFPRMGNPSESE